MTTRKRSNIITLNIHVSYEVSECRMSVRICTVYRIQSQTNIFVHRYSKYMCTAISLHLYVCHNFGTLKKEKKNSVLLYTQTPHSGSHVQSLHQTIEREKDSNVFLTIYTKKKTTLIQQKFLYCSVSLFVTQLSS